MASPTSTDPGLAALLAARPHLTMDGDGLCLDGVSLAGIARAAGTPCWVYGGDTIRRRCQRLRAALNGTGFPVRLHYAVKANSHLAVLALLAREGAGADVVSGGEIRRARAAGIAAADIVFSGVGKSPAELRLALEQGIAQINVESAEELAMLSALAAGMGRRARVALRVNPDVDAGTHAKITTGRAENKFGIAMADASALYARAAALPGIEPVGLAVHIGSQIKDMQAYRAAFARIAALVRSLRVARQPVRTVDCGGGLGIDYAGEGEAAPEEFAAALAEGFGGLDVSLAIEPGRWLAGPAGVLIAAVILTKHTGGRRFLVLDAAMNDLARPAMYDAWHGILPLDAAAIAAPAEAVDVVGPVCETGDTFARRRALPALPDGGLVALLDAGAYGAAMSSTYNARPLAPEVLVLDGGWQVIRPRQALDALWRDEIIPDTLRPR